LQYVAAAPVAMQRLEVCIERIEQWMGVNRLKLNQDKTQIIWIGTRQQLVRGSLFYDSF